MQWLVFNIKKVFWSKADFWTLYISYNRSNDLHSDLIFVSTPYIRPKQRVIGIKKTPKGVPKLESVPKEGVFG